MFNNLDEAGTQSEIIERIGDPRDGQNFCDVF
jgi:hypothetical protein